MPDIIVDNLTVTLLSTLAVLLIYLRFFSRPEPLVHPLLLGKQSEVSKVRQEGETGVYRSWATGHDAPLSVRPASTLKTVKDVILGPRTRSTAIPRCIVDTSLSDEALAEIIRLIPLGLEALFGLPVSGPTDQPAPIVTLLPASPSTALPLLLLQLAALPSAPLVILPTPQHLAPALREDKAHPLVKLLVVHASIVEDAIEQVWEDRQQDIGVLVVGDPGKERDYIVKDARAKGMKVSYWEEMWEAGEKKKAKQPTPEPQPSDIHSYFYSQVGKNEPQIVAVTHQNITAGIAGVLSSFPADKRPSAALGDTVGSAVPLDTPLGMSIALATLWTGASLRVIGDPTPDWDEEAGEVEAALAFLMADRNLPSPTVLFLTPSYYQAILQRLHQAYLKIPFISFLARHQFSHVTSGYISRKSWIENGALGRLRSRVLGGIAGDKLRAVTLVGGVPPPATLAMSHVLLGLPISRLHPSSSSAGPLFASHFFDLQIPVVPNIHTPLIFDKAKTGSGHTGPPAVNVEVKLAGDQVESETGEPLRGRLLARGPGLLRSTGEDRRPEEWLDLDEIAEVQTNGTFIIVGAR